MRDGLTKFGRPINCKRGCRKPGMQEALEAYRDTDVRVEDICSQFEVSRKGLSIHIKRLGINRNNWERGYTINHYGYVMVYAPDHPWPRKGTGQMLDHVRVMELHLGRRLERGEVVHHKDGDRLNNDFNNLQLMSNGDHTRFHRALRKARRTHQEAQQTALPLAD